MSTANATSTNARKPRTAPPPVFGRLRNDAVREQSGADARELALKLCAESSQRGQAREMREHARATARRNEGHLRSMALSALSSTEVAERVPARLFNVTRAVAGSAADDDNAAQGSGALQAELAARRARRVARTGTMPCRDLQGVRTVCIVDVTTGVSHMLDVDRVIDAAMNSMEERRVESTRAAEAALAAALSAAKTPVERAELEAAVLSGRQKIAKESAKFFAWAPSAEMTLFAAKRVKNIVVGLAAAVVNYGTPEVLEGIFGVPVIYMKGALMLVIALNEAVTWKSGESRPGFSWSAFAKSAGAQLFTLALRSGTFGAAFRIAGGVIPDAVWSAASSVGTGLVGLAPGITAYMGSTVTGAASFVLSAFWSAATMSAGERARQHLWKTESEEAAEKQRAYAADKVAVAAAAAAAAKRTFDAYQARVVDLAGRKHISYEEAARQLAAQRPPLTKQMWAALERIAKRAPIAGDTALALTAMVGVGLANHNCALFASSGGNWVTNLGVAQRLVQTKARMAVSGAVRGAVWEGGAARGMVRAWRLGRGKRGAAVGEHDYSMASKTSTWLSGALIGACPSTARAKTIDVLISGVVGGAGAAIAEGALAGGGLNTTLNEGLFAFATAAMAGSPEAMSARAFLELDAFCGTPAGAALRGALERGIPGTEGIVAAMNGAGAGEAGNGRLLSLFSPRTAEQLANARVRVAFDRSGDAGLKLLSATDRYVNHMLGKEVSWYGSVSGTGELKPETKPLLDVIGEMTGGAGGLLTPPTSGDALKPSGSNVLFGQAPVSSGAETAGEHTTSNTQGAPGDPPITTKPPSVVNEYHRVMTPEEYVAATNAEIARVTANVNGLLETQDSILAAQGDQSRGSVAGGSIKNEDARAMNDATDKEALALNGATDAARAGLAGLRAVMEKLGTDGVESVSALNDLLTAPLTACVNSVNAWEVARGNYILAVNNAASNIVKPLIEAAVHDAKRNDDAVRAAAHLKADEAAKAEYAAAIARGGSVASATEESALMSTARRAAAAVHASTLRHALDAARGTFQANAQAGLVAGASLFTELGGSGGANANLATAMAVWVREAFIKVAAVNDAAAEETARQKGYDPGAGAPVPHIAQASEALRAQAFIEGVVKSAEGNGFGSEDLLAVRTAGAAASAEAARVTAAAATRDWTTLSSSGTWDALMGLRTVNENAEKHVAMARAANIAEDLSREYWKTASRAVDDAGVAGYAAGWARALARAPPPKDAAEYAATLKTLQDAGASAGAAARARMADTFVESARADGAGLLAHKGGYVLGALSSPVDAAALDAFVTAGSNLAWEARTEAVKPPTALPLLRAASTSAAEAYGQSALARETAEVTARMTGRGGAPGLLLAQLRVERVIDTITAEGTSELERAALGPELSAALGSLQETLAGHRSEAQAASDALSRTVEDGVRSLGGEIAHMALEKARALGHEAEAAAYNARTVQADGASGAERAKALMDAEQLGRAAGEAAFKAALGPSMQFMIASQSEGYAASLIVEGLDRLPDGSDADAAASAAGGVAAAAIISLAQDLAGAAYVGLAPGSGLLHRPAEPQPPPAPAPPAPAVEVAPRDTQAAAPQASTVPAEDARSSATAAEAPATEVPKEVQAAMPQASTVPVEVARSTVTSQPGVSPAAEVPKETPNVQAAHQARAAEVRAQDIAALEGLRDGSRVMAPQFAAASVSGLAEMIVQLRGDYTIEEARARFEVANRQFANAYTKEQIDHLFGEGTTYTVSMGPTTSTGTATSAKVDTKTTAETTEREATATETEQASSTTTKTATILNEALATMYRNGGPIEKALAFCSHDANAQSEHCMNSSIALQAVTAASVVAMLSGVGAATTLAQGAGTSVVDAVTRSGAAYRMAHLAGAAVQQVAYGTAANAALGATTAGAAAGSTASSTKVNMMHVLHTLVMNDPAGAWRASMGLIASGVEVSRTNGYIMGAVKGAGYAALGTAEIVSHIVGNAAVAGARAAMDTAPIITTAAAVGLAMTAPALTVVGAAGAVVGKAVAAAEWWNGPTSRSEALDGAEAFISNAFASQAGRGAIAQLALGTNNARSLGFAVPPAADPIPADIAARQALDAVRMFGAQEVHGWFS